MVLSQTEFVSVHTYRFDNEISIRQSVEADIAGLKKVIDDTNMSRINIENEIEAVREELIFLKKNHDNVSLQSTHTLLYYILFTVKNLESVLFISLILPSSVCPVGGDGAEESDLTVRCASWCRCSQRSGPVPDHGGHENKLWEDSSEKCWGPQTVAWKSGTAELEKARQEWPYL